MDPISQGVIGAAATALIAPAKNKHLVTAIGLGALAGMAPDLDIFIQSSADPLLFLDYHRHFTHALLFIPIGALITAIVLYYLYARLKLSFIQTYQCCLLGYATHGLLDCCTTYGTYLFWPFSEARIAWNIIAVVDPLFTLPALLLLILAIYKKSQQFIIYGMVWMLFYLGFGVIQHYRAETAGLILAHSRGHAGINLTAKPSLGNLLLWKSIYEHQGYYYIDGVRTGIKTEVWQGECIEKFSQQRHIPWVKADSQQHRDIARFRHFSNGYIASSDVYPNAVVDIRYSALPHIPKPLWGIRLSPDKTDIEHVEYFVNHPSLSGELKQEFIDLLQGKLPSYIITDDNNDTCFRS